jgi:hypothetical protein
MKSEASHKANIFFFTLQLHIFYKFLVITKNNFNKIKLKYFFVHIFKTYQRLIIKF